MKLYVVKSGVYSDKKWHGIFTTPEKANELVEELILRRGGTGEPNQATPDEWGKPHYEEWEVDVPRELEEGHYEVVINKDGSVRDWEFENWGPNDGPPKIYGDCYLGFGSTLELARRSAEELRRADLTQRGLTRESSER